MAKYGILTLALLLGIWYFFSTQKDRRKAVEMLKKSDNFCYLAVDSHIRIYLINGMYPVRIKNTLQDPTIKKVYRMEYRRPVTVTYALRKRNILLQNYHTQKLQQNINAIPNHLYVFTTQIDDRQMIVTIEDHTKEL